MRRRECISLLGGAAALWPLAARGQQRGKVPRLGVLLFSNPQADPQMETVHSGLRELGCLEGRNLIVSRPVAFGTPWSAIHRADAAGAAHAPPRR